MFKVGIDTWIYHPALSIEKILERVEEHGFKYVEYAYEHFKTIKEPEKQLKRLVEISSSYDLKPVQMHAPYGNEEYQLGAEDENLRKYAKGVQQIVQRIAKAGKLWKFADPQVEFEIFQEFAEYIARETGLEKVIIEEAEEAKHPKADQALPGRPAILLT